MVPVLVVAAVAWWLLWPAPARIVSSEPGLTFDTVRVGRDGGSRRFQLSNEGERALRLERVSIVGEAAQDFVVAADECLGAAISSGRSCPVEVTFQPTAAGDRRASLEIHGKAGNSPFTVPVQAVAVAPAVGLAPESINFGSVQVGQQRARLKLTISNIGSAPLELGRVHFEGPQKDEFDRDQRCPTTTLDPGEACSFDVRFSPKAAGDRVAELLVGSDAPDQPTRLPMRGRGVWEGPPLEAEPEILDLGEQRVGQKSAGTSVDFVNRTAGTVEIASVELVPKGTPFAIAGDGCGSRSLISGDRCAVSVAVEPSGEGRVAATLEVGFADAGTLRVALAATGVAPRLEVDTALVEFGDLRSGFESGARIVTLMNTGSATLKIRQVRLIGRDPEDYRFKQACRSERLRSGERCELQVAFRPGAAGDKQAQIEITPSDDLAPIVVALGGTGTVAALAVEPASLRWQTLQIGEGDDRRLEISNSGSARLTIDRLRPVGEAASEFAVQAIGCRLDAGLAPGESCVVTIRFAPATEGEREAEIEISHNGPESPLRVALSGGGEPPQPLFRASAREFGFGTVAAGGRSDIATLTISNSGSAWLTLGGARLVGQHATDFELVPGTCDGVTALAPGGSCTVGVRFIPAAPGQRRGTLEVRHGAAGSPAQIALAGIGS